MIDLALIEACSFGVHPDTVVAVIEAESRGDPLAMNVNGLVGRSHLAPDLPAAAELASQYIAAGYSVDMGLMQINSQHLARFGATPEQAFEPCQNILFGTTILAENYQRARRDELTGDAAMRAALSIYNTGHQTHGQQNGYVERVLGPESTRAQVKIQRAAHSPLRVEFDTKEEDTMSPNEKSSAEVTAAIAQVREQLGQSEQLAIEVDPAVAEAMGAFEEGAIDAQDAIESVLDAEAHRDGQD